MVTTNLVKTFGILPNDRCTYIGKTGCGKTTLAEVILSQFNIDFDNQGPIYQMILSEVDATIEDYKDTL
jgi:cytidylate kinase